MGMVKHRVVLGILVVSFFACILWNGFCGDDNFLFVNNSFYKNPSNIARIFRPGYNVAPEDVQYGDAADKGTGSVGYRPVTTMSFFMDSFIWKDNPAGYHLTSILWHLANVFLLYEIAVVVAGPQVAFITALIFGIHPVNTEAVAAIGYRSDLLACFFLLAALLAWLSLRRDGSWRCAAISYTGYFFALFSKETALLFPCVIFFIDRVNFSAFIPQDRRNRYLPFLVIALFYLYIYYYVFPNTAFVYAPQIADGYEGHVTVFIQIVALYLKEIFFVFSAGVMPALYWPLPRPLFSPAMIFQGVLVAGAGGLLLAMILRRGKYSWAALWGLVFFLPALIFWVNPNPAALRYVYVPFAGLAFLAALGLVHVWGRCRDRLSPSMRVFLGFVGVVSLGLPAVSSNLVWRNNFTVADAWVKAYPEHYMGYGVKGTEFFKHKKYKEAAENLGLALQDPRCTNQIFDYQLGFSYLSEGRREEAKSTFEGLMAKAPFSDRGYAGMAHYYYASKQHALAVPYLQRAFALHDTDDNAENLLKALDRTQGASGLEKGLQMVRRVWGDGPRLEKLRESLRDRRKLR